MADQLIYTQLAQVMKDLSGVAKRDKNTEQRFLFRGIDAVLNAVGPVLRKHAVIVVPNVERADYREIISKSGTRGTNCQILASYEFYAEDGSSISCRVAGEASDYGDKATPKAMSVAFRTALIQALALPTDETDPDAQIVEEVHPSMALPTYHEPGDPPARAATRTRGPSADDDVWQTPEPMKDKTRGRLFALFGEHQIPDSEQLPGINAITGKAYTSRGDLTEADAQKVITTLAKRPKPTTATQTEEPA